jgi:hypothetical protein
MTVGLSLAHGAAAYAWFDASLSSAPDPPDKGCPPRGWGWPWLPRACVMGQDDPSKNRNFEPVKLRLDRSEPTLASVVAKARPGIRFNKYIESDCPTVFADACKPGLEGTCRSARTRPTFQDARPTGSEELGCTGREAGGRRGLGAGALAMNVARPVPLSSESLQT